ncbi:glucosylglycerol-phosphate synthase [Phenylobacterium sp.]|uniref:glucosylglycerol-phosphate synthase n=1 Tax=Phenylobacterium sp. TaxID=1871053 RepID=UPI0035AF512A
MSKSSLVIVYHRQPSEEVLEGGKIVYRTHKSPNGIVPTLKSFFNRLDPGAGAWVAWKIYDPEKGVDFERVVHVEDPRGGYTVSRLPLTKEEVESFYHITSKEALWPILHSFPRLYQYENVDWETFREVNRKFAEAAAEQVEDDGLVWVHDYNLWLVPAYLRALKPGVRIAFFHHTPFPAADVFNVLPWRREIIESLLKCDLVGFHIPRYAKNFADVARSLCGASIESTAPAEGGFSTSGMALSEPDFPDVLRAEGRAVRLGVAPVGANPELIDSILATDESHEQQQQLLAELGGRTLLMTVGRTDYTKGMIECLLAFERLLERRPDLIDKVKMLVTSVRAASAMTIYEDTQREIEATVGRINGRFSKLDWTPVVLFGAAIPFERLVAHYRIADVCLTTPLRDGLNLVAKEFVAAKQGHAGVLVLSEFAGCAVELGDAVLTNPYSNRSMDAAIDEALKMPAEESVRRMQAMDKVVRHFDLGHWADEVAEQFGDIAFAPRRHAAPDAA